MRSHVDADSERLGSIGCTSRAAASAQPFQIRGGPFDQERSKSQPGTRQHKLIRWAATQLMLVLILLFFVPMPGSAEDGNATFRLLILGIAAVATPGGMERPLLAARLANRLWPLWLLLSWLLLTSRWASYPDLSLRRGFAYVLILLIAIALATSFDRPRDFYNPMFKALGAVFVVNVISAHTVAPIDAGMGVNGIYAQKNGAGALALYLVIVATSGVVLYQETRVAPRLFRRGGFGLGLSYFDPCENLHGYGRIADGRPAAARPSPLPPGIAKGFGRERARPAARLGAVRAIVFRSDR